jgi:hypothetical protein
MDRWTDNVGIVKLTGTWYGVYSLTISESEANRTAFAPDLTHEQITLLSIVS